MMNPILTAAAVIPAVILMIRVYRVDRLEPEPTGLLVSLVLLGILSTLLATVIEAVGEFVLSLFFRSPSVLYNALLFFPIVGFGEEISKYLLLRQRTWRHPAFNCQFDGVVYAVFVSLGFALWENIGYVAMYGFGTALVRAVTAVPGHACFGVFMGVLYGLAKRYEEMGDLNRSQGFRRLSVIVPAVIHGLYDFIASLDSDAYGMIFLVFIALMFVIALRLIRRMARNDQFIQQKNPPYYP